MTTGLKTCLSAFLFRGINLLLITMTLYARTSFAGELCNLVLCLDGSDSMTDARWTAEMNAARKIVKQLNIDFNTGASVGMLVFSGNITSEIPLVPHKSEQALLDGIRKLKRRPDVTGIHVCLDRALNGRFYFGRQPRPEAQNVLVFFADGNSADEKATARELADAKRRNIKTIGVAIGGEENFDNLKEWEPHVDVFERVASFAALENAVGLFSRFCKDEVTSTSPEPLTPSIQLRSYCNLVLCLDGSDSMTDGRWAAEMLAAKRIVRGVRIDEKDGTSIGMLVFSSVITSRAPLIPHKTAAALLAAIDKFTRKADITGIHICLNVALNDEFFFGSNWRPKAHDVLVFFADGNSADYNRTAKYLRDARDRNIRTIGVAIGPDENFDNVYEWRDNVDRFERVPSFAALSNATELLENFCLQLPPTTTTVATTGLQLPGSRLCNLVLCLDGSDSMTDARWASEMEAARRIVNGLVIDSSSGASVGMIVFSDVITSQTPLIPHKTAQYLLDSIDLLKRKADATGIHVCLNLAINGKFYFGNNPRPQAQNVLVFFADGNSANPKKTAEYLAQAKRRNIKTVGFAIGPDDNYDDPYEWRDSVDKFERVASFAALALATDLFEGFCKDAPIGIISTTRPPSTTTKPTTTTKIPTTTSTTTTTPTTSTTTPTTTTTTPTTTSTTTTTTTPTTRRTTTTTTTTPTTTTLPTTQPTTAPTTTSTTTAVTTPSSPIKTLCNLVVCLDGSDSMTKATWTYEKMAAKKIVRNHVVDAIRGASIGLIVYSDGIMDQATLVPHKSSQALINAIDGFTTEPGRTNVHVCLDLAVNGQFYFRDNPRRPAKNVLAFIVDGNAADPERTTAILNTARQRGINTVGIGVGPDENFDDPNKWGRYRSRSGEAVSVFAPPITGTHIAYLGKGAPVGIVYPTTATTTVSTPTPTMPVTTLARKECNLVMCLDGSEHVTDRRWTLQLIAAREVVQRLAIDNATGASVGVMVYSDNVTSEITLHPRKSSQRLLYDIEKLKKAPGLTNTHICLDRAVTDEAYFGQPLATADRNVLAFFADGDVSDSSATSWILEHAKRYKIRTVAVVIGRKNRFDKVDEWRKSVDRFVNVDSFLTLASAYDLLGSFCLDDWNYPKSTTPLRSPSASNEYTMTRDPSGTTGDPTLSRSPTPMLPRNPVTKLCNLVLCLDGSEHITDAMWAAQILAAKRIIRGLELDNTRGSAIGLIAFADIVTSEASLFPFKSAEVLTAILDNFRRRLGVTNIHTCLNIAINDKSYFGYNHRPNAQNVLVFFADGNSFNPAKTAESLALAKARSIRTFAVAVGRKENFNDVYEWRGKVDQYERVASWSELAISYDLFDSFCENAPTLPPTTSSPTTTPIPTTTTTAPPVCELVVCVDGSEHITKRMWAAELEAVKIIARNLVTTDQTGNSLGVMVYSSEIASQSPLRPRKNIQDLLKAIRQLYKISGITNIHVCLDRAINEASYFGQKIQGQGLTRRVLVFFTDGNSADRSRTAQHLVVARMSGIRTVAVAVGADGQYDDVKEWTNTATRVERVSSFSALAADVQLLNSFCADYPPSTTTDPQATDRTRSPDPNGTGIPHSTPDPSATIGPTTTPRPAITKLCNLVLCLDGSEHVTDAKWAAQTLAAKRIVRSLVVDETRGSAIGIIVYSDIVVSQAKLSPFKSSEILIEAIGNLKRRVGVTNIHTCLDLAINGRAYFGGQQRDHAQNVLVFFADGNSFQPQKTANSLWTARMRKIKTVGVAVGPSLKYDDINEWRYSVSKFARVNSFDDLAEAYDLFDSFCEDAPTIPPSTTPSTTTTPLTTTSTAPPQVCQMVVCVDGSEHITQTMWKAQLEAVRTIARTLVTDGLTGHSLGVIVYSNGVTSETTLLPRKPQQVLITQINQLYKRPGITNIHTCLDRAINGASYFGQKLQGQGHIRKVIVFFTDGNSADRSKTAQHLVVAQMSGIRTVAVAVGADGQYDDVKEWTNTATRVERVSSFSALAADVQLLNSFCADYSVSTTAVPNATDRTRSPDPNDTTDTNGTGIPQSTPDSTATTGPTTPPRPAIIKLCNLVLCLDGSEHVTDPKWAAQTLAAKRIVRRLVVDKTRGSAIGIIVYSDIVVSQTKLSPFKSSEILLEAIGNLKRRVGVTNIHTCLDLAINGRAYFGGDQRKHAQNVLVFFADGNSFQPQKTANSLWTARMRKIKTVGVAIGPSSKYDDINEWRYSVSKFARVNSFEDLAEAYDLFDSFCEDAPTLLPSTTPSTTTTPTPPTTTAPPRVCQLVVCVDGSEHITRKMWAAQLEAVRTIVRALVTDSPTGNSLGVIVYSDSVTSESTLVPRKTQRVLISSINQLYKRAGITNIHTCLDRAINGVSYFGPKLQDQTHRVLVFFTNGNSADRFKTAQHLFLARMSGIRTVAIAVGADAQYDNIDEWTNTATRVERVASFSALAADVQLLNSFCSDSSALTTADPTVTTVTDSPRSPHPNGTRIPHTSPLSSVPPGPTTTPRPPIIKWCNLVLCMDGSEHVTDGMWAAQILAARRIVRSMVVDETRGSAIGIIVYSDTVVSQSRLSPFKSSEILLEAIGNLKRRVGVTNIHTCLDLAISGRAYFGGDQRKHAQNVLVFFADGNSYQPQKTANSLWTARMRKIKTVGVAVGPSSKYDDVNEWRYSVSKFARVNSFEDLANAYDLFASFCEDAPTLPPQTTPPTSATPMPTTAAPQVCQLVVCVDGSEHITKKMWDAQLEAVRTIARTLVTEDRTGNSLGVIVYSNSVTSESTLVPRKTQRILISKIAQLYKRPGITNIHACLDRAINGVGYFAQKPRGATHRVLAFFTDGNSADRSKTAQHLFLARMLGIRTVAVAVGEDAKYDDVKEWANTATRVERVPSFAALAADVSLLNSFCADKPTSTTRDPNATITAPPTNTPHPYATTNRGDPHSTGDYSASTSTPRPVVAKLCNLVLCLDGSEHVTDAKWAAQILAAKRIVRSLVVDETRGSVMGIIVYSDTVVSQTKLSPFKSTEVLIEAIGNLRKRVGVTNIHTCLDLAINGRAYFGGKQRSNSQNVLVFFADGNSFDRGKTASSLWEAEKREIRTVGVAIGPESQYDDINEWRYTVDKFARIASFDDLAHAYDLFHSFCEGAPTLPPSTTPAMTTSPAPTTTSPAPTTTSPAPTTTSPAPTTTSPAPTTTVSPPRVCQLVVCVDGSEHITQTMWEAQLEAVRTIARGLVTDGPTGNSLGIIVYSDSVTSESTLLPRRTAQIIISNINKLSKKSGITNIHVCLDRAINGVAYFDRKPQSQTRRVLVFFTDGNSADRSKTAQNLAVARVLGIETVAVAVGADAKYDDVEEWTNTATRVERVPSFAALAADIRLLNSFCADDTGSTTVDSNGTRNTIPTQRPDPFATTDPTGTKHPNSTGHPSSLTPPTTPPLPTTAKLCNLVLCLDGSEHVTEVKWAAQILAARRIVRSLVVDETRGSMIGVIVYSDIVVSQTRLSPYKSSDVLQEAIGNLRKRVGVTNIHTCLDLAINSQAYFGGKQRSNSQNVLVFFADGNSYDRGKTASSLWEARKRQIRTVGVAIGSESQYDDVNEWRYTVDKFARVASFDDLAQAYDLFNSFCEDAPTIPPSTTPTMTSSAPTTTTSIHPRACQLVVCVDGSEHITETMWKHQLQAVRTLARTLVTDGLTGNSLGVIVYSDSVSSESTLVPRKTALILISEINKLYKRPGITNIHTCLDRAINGVSYFRRNPRSQTRRVLVFFTDGNSADRSKTAKHLSVARLLGIQTVAVAVGADTKYDDVGEWTDTATRVERVPSFAALATDVRLLNSFCADGRVFTTLGPNGTRNPNFTSKPNPFATTDPTGTRHPNSTGDPSSSSPTTPPRPTVAKLCNLVLCLDGSEHVTDLKWAAQILAARRIVRSLVVDETRGSMIGVIVYSDIVVSQTRLTPYKSSDVLLEAIGNLRKRVGVTNIHTCLDLAINGQAYFGGKQRSNSQNVLVFFADGNSFDRARTASSLWKARKREIRTVGVAIGPDSQYDNVNEWRYTVDEFARIASFDDLAHAYDLFHSFCEGAPTLPPSTTPKMTTSPAPTIITTPPRVCQLVVCVDGSEHITQTMWEAQLEAVRTITRTLVTDGPTGNSLGVIVYSDSVTSESTLLPRKTAGILISKINLLYKKPGITNIHACLDRAINGVGYFDRKPQSQTRRVLVFFTDGNSADRYKTAQQLLVARMLDIRTVAVAVGANAKYDDVGEWTDTATRVERVPSFAALAADVRLLNSFCADGPVSTTMGPTGTRTPYSTKRPDPFATTDLTGTRHPYITRDPSTSSVTTPPRPVVAKLCNLVLCLDGSEHVTDVKWAAQILAARRIVRSLVVDETRGSMIGVIVYSDIVVSQTRLTPYKSSDVLQEAIGNLRKRVGVTNIHKCLDLAINSQAYFGGRKRSNSQNVLVFFADGNSYDRGKTASSLWEARKRQIRTVGVAIGPKSQYDDVNEWRYTVDKFARVASFDDLAHAYDLFDSFCEGAPTLPPLTTPQMTTSPVPTTHSTPSGGVCQLVVCVDGSEHITQTMWEAQLEAVRTIARTLVTDGPTGNSLGVIVYSDSVTSESTLLPRKTARVLIAKINQLFKKPGVTNIHACLDHAINKASYFGTKSRGLTRRVLVFFTDGNSADRYKTARHLVVARMLGIRTVAVAVGADAKYDDVEEWTDTATRVERVPSFADLAADVRLHDSFCADDPASTTLAPTDTRHTKSNEGPDALSTTTDPSATGHPNSTENPSLSRPTTPPRPTIAKLCNLVLCLDGSEHVTDAKWAAQILAARRIVRSLVVDETRGSMIGVIVYSDIVVSQTRLTPYKSSDVLLEAIGNLRKRVGVTNIHTCLDLAINGQAYFGGKQRSNSQNVLVFFADGNSYDRGKTASSLWEARKRRIRTVGVAIGPKSQYDDVNEWRYTVDKFARVASFDDLAHTYDLFDSFCEGAPTLPPSTTPVTTTSPAPTTTSTPPQVCQLVVCVDGSEHITQTMWEAQLEAVRTIARTLVTDGPTGNSLGVIVYSDSVTSESALLPRKTARILISEINLLYKKPGITNIHVCLDRAINGVGYFDRKSQTQTRRVLVFFTDGNSADRYKTAQQLLVARMLDIRTVAVAVGADAKYDDVGEWTDTATRVERVPSFAAMAADVRLLNSFCADGRVSTTMGPNGTPNPNFTRRPDPFATTDSTGTRHPHSTGDPSSPRPTTPPRPTEAKLCNLVLCLDGSEHVTDAKWAAQILAARRIVRSLVVDETHGSMIGVIVYSDIVVSQTRLTPYKSSDVLVEAIGNLRKRVGVTNIHTCLDLAINGQAYFGGKQRSNSQNVLVFFADGNSYDRGKTASSLWEARKRRIWTVGVAIGPKSQYDDVNEWRYTVDKFARIASFDDLAHAYDLFDSFCEGAPTLAPSTTPVTTTSPAPTTTSTPPHVCQLVVCVDGSEHITQTMWEAQLEAVRTIARTLVTDGPTGNSLGVIVYSDSVTSESTLLPRKTARVLISKINQLYKRPGITNIHACLDRAINGAAYFGRKPRGATHRVLAFFTDGNSADRSKTAQQLFVARMLGIRTVAVAVGEDAKYDDVKEWTNTATQVERVPSFAALADVRILNSFCADDPVHTTMGPNGTHNTNPSERPDPFATTDPTGTGHPNPTGDPSSLSPTTPPGPAIAKYCNLVLCLDGSEHVTDAKWAAQILAARRIVRSLVVDETRGSMIGIIVYSDIVVSQTRLAPYKSSDVLQEAIGNLRKRVGVTNIHTCLDLAINGQAYFGGKQRSNSQNVLVFFADGNSFDRGKTASSLWEARKRQIRTVGVAIGPKSQYDDVNEWRYTVDKFARVSSFDDLADAYDLFRSFCEDAPTPPLTSTPIPDVTTPPIPTTASSPMTTPRTTISSPDPRQLCNVVLCLDGSEHITSLKWWAELEAGRTVVRGLFLDEVHGAAIGMMVYSDRIVSEITLIPFKSTEEILASMENLKKSIGITNLHICLNRAVIHPLYFGTNPRRPAQNVLVFFVDGNTANKTKTAANLKLAKHVYTVGVAIGPDSDYDNVTELKYQVNRFVRIPSFLHLAKSVDFLNSLCDGAPDAGMTSSSTARSSSSTPSPPPEKSCDVVVCLDGSEHITDAKWASQLKAAKRLIQEVGVDDRQKAAVGMIVYSDVITSQATLIPYKNEQVLIDLLKTFKRRIGITNIHVCLDIAINGHAYFGHNPQRHAHNVLVFFIDGNSANRTETSRLLRLARSRSIRTIGVAVGLSSNFDDENEWRDQVDTFERVQSFADLEMSTDLFGRVCQVSTPASSITHIATTLPTKITTTRLATTTNKPTTIPTPTTTTPTAKPTTSTTKPTTATKQTTMTPTSTSTKPTTTAKPTTSSTIPTTAKPTTTTKPTTMEPTTNVPSNNTVKHPCDDCRMENGVGFNPDPKRCDCWYRCEPLPKNEFQETHLCCGCDKFWDQDSLTCRLAPSITCANDPCRGSRIKTYALADSCNAYWSCSNGRTHNTECCPHGHRYDRLSRRCVYATTTCFDKCPCLDQTLTTSGPCHLIYDNTDVRYFYQNAGNGRYYRQRCAPGTYFSNTTCGCVLGGGPTITKKPTEECMPDFSANYSNGEIKDAANDVHIQNHGVTVMRTGRALFRGNAHYTVPRYANHHWGNTVAIRIRFNDEGYANRDGVLLSNTDCKELASVEVRLADKKSNRPMVVASIRMSKKQYLLQLPYRRGEDNQIFMSYDGKKFKLSVLYVNNEKVMLETAAEGGILSRDCGLQVGYGWEDRFFTGTQTQTDVYLCIPANFHP